MAVIADFIDQSTGTLAGYQKIQDALINNSYGGLTGIDAAGQVVPSGTPLAQPLLDGKMPARFEAAYAASLKPNYVMWAGLAILVWYFFLRRK